MAWRSEVVHHMVIDLDQQTITLDGEEWTYLLKDEPIRVDMAQSERVAYLPVLVDHVTVIDMHTPPL